MRSHEERRLLQIATWASISVAMLLIGLKIFGWLATESVSILASLVDSVMDLFASSISFFAVRYALQPPDAEHRFGHGKAEPLAALAQAAFVAGSSMMLALQSFENLLFREHQVSDPGTGVTIILISIALTLALVTLQRYVLRRVSSEALEGDALHYKGDILLNVAVLSALILAYLNLSWFDPLIGLSIAGYLLWSVRKLATNALASLMDEEVGPDLEVAIRRAASALPNCKGVHDIRTRRAGPQIFAQMHLEFDGSLSLKKAHDLGEHLVARLQREYPGIQVTVHHDPT